MNKIILLFYILFLIANCKPKESQQEEELPPVAIPAGVPKEAVYLSGEFILVENQDNIYKKKIWTQAGILRSQTEIKTEETLERTYFISYDEETEKKDKENKSVKDLNKGQLIEANTKNFDKFGKVVSEEIYKNFGDYSVTQILYNGWRDEIYKFKNYEEILHYDKDLLFNREIILKKEKIKVKDRDQNYNVSHSAIFLSKYKIFMDGETKDGIREGLWKIWIETGEETGFVNFKNGKLDGQMRFQNRAPIREGAIALYREYKDGEMVKDLLPHLYEKDNDPKLKAEWEKFIETGMQF